MTVLGALAARGGREVQNLTAWGDWSGHGTETWSGHSVSATSSLQLLNVYGCTRFICDGIATLPVDVFRDTPDGPVEMPAPDWLKQPTPDLDYIAWATQLLTSWLLAGNVFVMPEYANGALRNVRPIDPTTVTVRRERGRKVFDINGETFTSLQVKHSPGPMWPGSDIGMSPVEAARQMIGSGMAAEEFAGRFFGQGATLSGVIEVPGELEPAKAREMARSWGKKHGGSSNSGLPGVLQGGAVWKPTGVSNEQSQFLETRGYTASQIAASMFLIDPQEMGLPVEGTSLTYANQEQRNTRKLQVTFLPWIIRLEKLVNDLLPKPRYMKANANALLRGDTKTRFDGYRVALGPNVPFMEVDQVRALEEWPAMPDTSPQETG